MEEQSGVPARIEGEGAPVTGVPEDVPIKPVKGASRSEPKRAPGNVGRKSGGKGGKLKSSSKKGDDEGGKELE